MIPRSLYHSIMVMYILCSTHMLNSHGFAGDTYIRSGEGAGWWILKQTAHEITQRKKVRVAKL